MKQSKFDMGVVMLDVEGLTLKSAERELLSSSQVGGVILFSRNYASPDQLRDLVAAIKQSKDSLLVAVDQEGGRVQRFREHFLTLPSLREIGLIYEQDVQQGLDAAKLCAWAMAVELRQYGIDISFAPVLDLFHANSPVIKERSFSPRAEQVAELGLAYIAGMHEAGMAATGKHFPGHGKVMADSHLELPRDERSLDKIRAEDLHPFSACIKRLDAIMPAHIVYPSVDLHCAGFSKFWIQSILREELGFDGVVFSDDLTMNAVHSVGSVSQRAELALTAGCDMVLVCNNPLQAGELVDYLETKEQRPNRRISRMVASQEPRPLALKGSDKWLAANELIEKIAN